MTAALHGRRARGRRSDGRPRPQHRRKGGLHLRQPKELGGDGEGANPEQLLAIGYAACFASSLDLVAQRKGLDARGVAIDSRVMLVPAAGGGFGLGVELDVSLPSIDDPAQAADLVRVAHQVCPYSNATRGNIGVALTVNGARP